MSENDPRYWILDVPPSWNTSDDNRINEVNKAARMPLVALVDENDGGVVGYIHVEYADSIAEALNADSKERA